MRVYLSKDWGFIFSSPTLGRIVIHSSDPNVNTALTLVKTKEDLNILAGAFILALVVHKKSISTSFEDALLMLKDSIHSSDSNNDELLLRT